MIDLNRLYSERVRGTQPSAIREICKLIDAPNMRSLAGGWPDPAIFPNEKVSQIVSDLLATQGDKVLQYGTTEGLFELRAELSQLAGEWDGIDCSPDQIMITHGSAQGMDLACRVFIDPGDVVMVGLPTYFGGSSTVSSYNGVNVGVPVDEEGLDVELLAARLRTLSDEGQSVKGIYLVPNFQNPTGTTLPLERREKLLALAEQYNLIIFEDDPYGELRFEGAKLPPLMALDTSGRVIHMRSFSKIFSPGMRLAWVAGHADVVRKMTIAKQFADVATNTLSQYVLLEFIKRGFLEQGIARIKKHYHLKRDFILQQLEKHFPKKVTWNHPAGGFFIFVSLPKNLNAMDLLTEALDHNVAFVAGAPFFVDGSGQNTLRLSYSQASKEDIEIAVASLGQLIKEQLA
jgi:2-aminoadipate transaminase